MFVPRSVSEAAPDILRRLVAEAGLLVLSSPAGGTPFIDPQAVDLMAAEAPALTAVMARLFLGGAVLPETSVRAALGDAAVAPLLDARVLQRAPNGLLASAHLLVSCCNRLVLAAPPPGHPRFHAAAAPYCGPESLWFAQFLALRGPYRTALDLCTGSGLLAMLPDSADVVAVDIDAAALEVAAFNLALNRRHTVTLLHGDLFAPVAGARFDLITANPPFLPGGPGRGMPACGDGGRRGDEILARILADAAHHLPPGGEALIYAEGFGDRTGPAILADLGALSLSRAHDYTCWIGGSRNAQQMIFTLCNIWQMLGATEEAAWAHWRDVAAMMPVTHYHHAIWRVADGHGSVAVRRLRPD